MITKDDFFKCCRCCLSLSEKCGEKLQPLIGTSLDEMLAELTSIKVWDDYQYPQQICFWCVLKLSTAFQFRRSVIETQRKLNIILEASNNVKYDISEKADDPIPRDECRTETDHEIYEDDSIPVDNTCTLNLETSSVSVRNADGENIKGLGNKIEVKVLLESSMKDTPNEKGVGSVAVGNKIECLKCSEEFEQNIDLKLHMMTHKEKPSSSCTICDTSVPKKLMKHHIRSNHGVKPYICEYCSREFAEKSNLYRHIKSHTGELRNLKGRPYLCNVCGKKFKWPSSLYKHMKYHTGKSLYVCDICSKPYSEFKSLQIHLRSHTGEKPFRCDTCGLSFTQQSNLTRHKSVHSGNRPYECNLCNKTFTQKGGLTLHKKSHSEKPHKCTVCLKSFVALSALTNHTTVHENWHEKVKVKKLKVKNKVEPLFRIKKDPILEEHLYVSSISDPLQNNLTVETVTLYG